MNWSYLAHVIGDMHDDEDDFLVAVQLSDGSIVYPKRMQRDEYGQWRLIVRGPTCDKEETR